MKERKLLGWDNREQNSALLFFSQLVEELMFYYTIDSFRLPAHNSRTLIDEAIKTIDHINDNILRDGSLEPIRKEIVTSIAKDKVFAEIFRGDISTLLNTIEKGSKSENHKALKYLQRGLKNKYRILLTSTIRNKILNNDFDDLVRMTKYLLIEILYSGHSVDYVNVCNSKIFMKQRVSDISAYDQFISCFNKDNKSYKIILNTETNLHKFNEYFNSDVINVKERPDIDIRGDEHDNIHRFNALGGYFVHVNIDAIDSYRAFSSARYTTENICANIKFLQHQGDYSVSRDGLIVDGAEATYYAGHNNPIFRRPDIIKEDKLKDKLKVIIKSLVTDNIDTNSHQRLILAYHRHLSGLRSVSYENQLVDLWSGIEILIPVLNKDSTDKITQVQNALVPIISDKYTKKLIRYMYDSIRRSQSRKVAFNVLKSIDNNYENALGKCMCLPEFADRYEEIYNIYKSYPLLQKRIEYYRNKFMNIKDLHELIKNHRQRVGWQLQRIYRGRNLIIHSGKTPYRLETLIENLHLYFDILLNAINHEFAHSDDEITLDCVYVNYALKQSYLDKYLKDNSNLRMTSKIYEYITSH